LAKQTEGTRLGKPAQGRDDGGYRKKGVEEAINLLLLLSSSRRGLTYKELIEALSLPKQTIARMIRALRMTEFDIVGIGDPGQEHRFRIDGSPQVRHLLMVKKTEVAEVALAAKRLEDEGLKERAELLNSLLLKLRTAMATAAQPQSLSSVQAQLEAEGTAARPRPQVALPDGVLSELRSAILSRRMIDLLYRLPGREPRTYRMEPYGLLYGDASYLLGQRPESNKPELGLWRFDRILGVEMTKCYFKPRPGYTLVNFMADSFGVFREPPFDVELIFSADAADDARAWHFHHSQQLSDLPNGRLRVCFRAGGIREMAHHLIRWRKDVEVIAPPELRDELRTLGQFLVNQYPA
jgi:predicted DNA-binding transcriptional regulator YafY